MSSISVAIIAHNEARCIEKNLHSIEWADEIVVIDCDSTDDTALICSRFNVEVYHEPNRVNLNINKNIAIDRCSSEWILVLDADEIIPYDLAGEIRLTVNEGKHDGYRIARRNHILGRWLRHGGQYPDWQLRLFRRTCGRFPEQHIHERIKINGSIGRLKLAFDHYPYHDLNDMMRKNTFYAQFEARHLHRLNKGISLVGLIFKAGIKPAIRYIRRYLFKGGFLDGIPGLITACFDAWNQAVRWFWLWDIKRRGNSEEDND